MLARVVWSRAEHPRVVPSVEWKRGQSVGEPRRNSCLSLLSKTHRLLFSVWAWSLQCGQRAAGYNGRENRGARGSGDREESVGEQIGPEMRGRGGYVGAYTGLYPTGSLPSPTPGPSNLAQLLFNVWLRHTSAHSLVMKPALNSSSPGQRQADRSFHISTARWELVYSSPPCSQHHTPKSE